MTKICVTGASGFVGTALCSALHARGFAVRGAVRSLHSFFSASGVEPVAVGNLDAATDWSSALAGVNCVIHCAARAHVMHETEADALAAYLSVNVDATRRLAEQAAGAGVRRFVYISSIKVNGETTDGLSHPFGDRDEVGELNAPPPEDPYSVSKWEAEQLLRVVSQEYWFRNSGSTTAAHLWSRCQGQSSALDEAGAIGYAVILGAVRNKRSLLIDNLVDLLIRCVDHPAAAGQTLLVSDGEDISTPDLLSHMAIALAMIPELAKRASAITTLHGQSLW